MPLIYSGQEVGNDNSLEFFMRDPIVWEDRGGFTQFYQELIAMRDAHPSMYAPREGAPMVILASDRPEQVFAGFTQFYQELIAMRDAHPSMYAPREGAPMVILASDRPEQVFAFERRLSDGSDGFAAVFNFSAEEVTVTVSEGSIAGQSYTLPNVPPSEGGRGCWRTGNALQPFWSGFRIFPPSEGAQKTAGNVPPSEGGRGCWRTGNALQPFWSSSCIFPPSEGAQKMAGNASPSEGGRRETENIPPLEGG